MKPTNKNVPKVLSAYSFERFEGFTLLGPTRTGGRRLKFFQNVLYVRVLGELKMNANPPELKGETDE